MAETSLNHMITCAGIKSLPYSKQKGETAKQRKREESELKR